jgi:glycosyltransferase involved in cell wall biosynthesis
MRIAYVTETHPPEINGVALTVARTIAWLRGHGHEVDVIRPAQRDEPKGAGDGEWRASGWPIPVYRELRFGMALPSTLAERFRADGAELVHIATEGPLGWAAARAAKRAGLVTTSDFRTNFHQYSRYYRLGTLEPLIRNYLRRFHNATDLSFVPTTRARRELAEAGFERVRVVGRGVDLERFSPRHRSAALRRSWGIDDDAPVLLYVGRIAAEKKIELALQAFRSAQRLEPRARMIVVGSGPLRRALEPAYPEARFIGMQTGDALAACYASADLFVFPSESETFGNVTLEALASGLPVVAFDSAAAGEHVVDRINGRIVPPGKDAAFVVATCLMTSLHRELRAAGAAARRSVEGQGWDHVLHQFESHLVETLHRAEPARTATACAA